MKQLSLFHTSNSDDQKHEPREWHLYVDGAARNNPGPAGAGIYIVCNGTPVVEQGFFLGTKTNNQAEYIALILGLCQIRQHLAPVDMVRIFSDSELLIRQLEGVYVVRNRELKILHERVKKQLALIKHSVHHVVRSLNEKADALANAGIDNKVPVPHELAHLCHI